MTKDVEQAMLGESNLHVSSMFSDTDRQRRLYLLDMIGYDPFTAALVNTGVQAVHFNGSRHVGPEHSIPHYIGSVQLWVSGTRYYISPHALCVKCDVPLKLHFGHSYCSKNFKKTTADMLAI